MRNITEIIPDNMPEWMKHAMDEGQLFRLVIEKVMVMEADSKATVSLLRRMIVNNTGRAERIARLEMAIEEHKEIITETKVKIMDVDKRLWDALGDIKVIGEE